MRFTIGLLLAAGTVLAGDGRSIAARFAEEVSWTLSPPAGVQHEYAARLGALGLTESQFLAVVDRNPHVQAFLLYWMAPGGEFHFIGASPVSTGRPGRFDYFQTTLGVFEHWMANYDYRALGTRNKYGIRGYGRRGLRIFDFGWVRAPKGWGDRAVIDMRLQMHSTDARYLEPKLGTAQSKGCIRIHSSLNVFLDRYGILDADYVRAAREGERPYVLRDDWEPTPWPGRFLVVVDSEATERPAWSPPPARR